MSDAISRFDAQKLVYDYCHARTVEGRQLKSPAVFTTHTGTDLAEAIGTLPAVQPKVKPLVWHERDEPDEWKSGPYDVWREFGRYQLYHWSVVMGEPHKTAAAAKAAAQADYEAQMLSALEPAVQPGHVNETPKSEHDARDVLTLTAERDRLAAAVDAVMADRKRIIEERDRGFVMVMERAERAEAEVARLTALLPHPGETAQEVMWRNHQRGVRLEELAKTAGVTRERARQMVRKAEMRMGGA